MKSLFVLAASLVPFLLAGVVPANAELTLHRRQAQTAGNKDHYDHNYKKEDNNNAHNQKNIDRLRETDRHSDVTQKQQQKDVQGDCFLTYENWDAYVDWDRNGKKNDYGHNKNVGAQKGVQHCILTVAELNVVERQVQNQHQKQRQQANVKNSKKNGKNHQQANVETHSKDSGDITEQLAIEARFCVVEYTTAFAQIEKDAKKTNDNKLKNYSDGAFDNYYQKNFGDIGNYNNFKSAYYKPQCIVFYFQLQLYKQWDIEVNTQANKKIHDGKKDY